MNQPVHLTPEENDTARTLAYVLKPQKPDPYTGIIDAEECLNFVDSYKEYYKILQLHPDRWVSYVVLSLTGDARSWWRTSGLKLETPWAEFRTAFMARFTPPDSANKAREALQRLKQGRRSVAVYTAEFLRFVRLIPTMDKGDALYQYLIGLEPTTSTQVRLRQPTNLDAAVTEATIVHSILFPNGLPQVGPNPAPQAPSDPMAMEIDNLRLEINALRRQLRSSPPSKASPPLPKLSHQERERLMRRGGCFRCRGDGHKASECPGRSLNNLSVPDDFSDSESGKAASN